MADLSVIGSSPLSGARVRLFVDGERLILTGPVRGGVVEVIMREGDGGLEEVARRKIPTPWTLFGGELVPLDRNPKTGAHLLLLIRDGPFSSVLYEAFPGQEDLESRGRVRGDSPYARCDPTEE